MVAPYRLMRRQGPHQRRLGAERSRYPVLVESRDRGCILVATIRQSGGKQARRACTKRDGRRVCVHIHCRDRAAEESQRHYHDGSSSDRTGSLHGVAQTTALSLLQRKSPPVAYNT